MALQRDVSLADASMLKSMRNEIIAFATNATADSQRAREGAAATKAQAERHLAESREESRKQVHAIMEGMREFDPYLRFASAADEEAYRKREAERRAYIDRESAKGTAQGDLNAARAAREQLLDAGVHGADASPEYAPRLERLNRASANLQEAMGVEPEGSAMSPPASTKATTSTESGLDTVLSALKAAGVSTLSAPPPKSAHGLGDLARAVRGLDTAGRT